jgi:hypothetical protein
MPAQVYKGGKFYISSTTVSADLTQSGFEALTWVEVGNVVTTPGMGVTDNMISQAYLDTDVSQWQKGIAAATEGELVVGYDPNDAGQEDMRAAAAGRSTWAFKSELSDSPNPATTTNTIRYTWGLVGSGGDTGGGPEDFVNPTFGLRFNQRPIWVAPEAI